MSPPIGSLWDAVGNTPLLRIGSLSRLTGCEILGKAEFMNPGGSIKDRAAKGMIRRAEEQGLLRPGGTIVEGTAGNTGIGLGLLGGERGYRVVVTMPDNQAREKYELLEAHGGGDVRLAPVPFSNPDHFFHRARALAEEHGWFWANQFENTANGDFHAETTGRGDRRAVRGQARRGGERGGDGRDHLGREPRREGGRPAHAGGAGRPVRLRPVLLRPRRQGRDGGGSITEGIGIMRITENFRRAQVDEAMRVSDQEMIEMAYHLGREDALVVGTSAALNVRAAYEIARRHRGEGLRIVTFLCDHGSRYASKLLDPGWLKSKGLVPRALPT